MLQMRHSTTLTTQQHAAIAALMTCRTVIDAAASVGVNPRTLHRWQNDAAFIAALHAAQLDASRHATRRLSGALAASVTTVVHLAESSEDEPTRLRAALAVASMLRELSEHTDFEARISALENRNGH